eukprot:CAMPEP_0170181798 /NCGR_PEP_ID=MMETSP0040_2-20121228/26033_1 /TAXON_ID=641309 /ORGANISM="Lotharella oceanica, Strain CCMP622" /LENGTH=95 /DNA_ID=CAMNT_0010426975 /DNA_START=44 /DNA_END=328 /DNA_ORIENTATION=+
MVSVVVDTVGKEGILGLYKGIGPTLAGALPYEGLKFGSYDALTRYMPRNEEGNLTVVGKLFCGGMAGSIAGFSMYPNDTVRRLLQMQEKGTERRY